MLLEGKVAVVTGAASGIGAATAARLTEEGATVIITDIVDGPGVEHLDVTDPASWRAFIARIAAEHGRIDLVHLNAGIHPGISDITTVDDENYRRHVAVNVDGVFFGLRTTLEQMRQQPDGGAIVITASLAGLVAYPIDPVYNLTKHAVVGLMRGTALVAGAKITVNCVNPGIVNTPMLGESGLALLTEAGFPVIEARDVADAVVQAATSGRTGEAWIVQPGVCEPFRFPSVPGPRTDGDAGKLPPLSVG